jgi:hypothetical protein
LPSLKEGKARASKAAETSALRRRSALVSFSYVAQASTSTSFRGLGDFAIRSAGVERRVARLKHRLPLAFIRANTLLVNYAFRFSGPVTALRAKIGAKSKSKAA